MENAIGSKNNTVEGFLGERWFSAMKTVLDEIGVEALEDFKEINKEEMGGEVDMSGINLLWI